MKTKFLIYIVPILFLAFGIAIKQEKVQEPKSWTVAEIQSGNKFTVSKGIRTKKIDLCGVLPISNTKNHLTRLINLGNGSVELEKVAGGYEVWIALDKDYDVELVKHISNKPNYLVGQEIHLNTWLIERGMAELDRDTYSKCREPENLEWAEKIAQDFIK